MWRPRIILGSVAVALVICSSFAFSSGIFLSDQKFMVAKLDADEARELKESGQIMSLESLIALLREDYPGQIIEIELDDKGDRYIYEIELVNDEGIVIELEIDARTGEVLKYKKDY